MVCGSGPIQTDIDVLSRTSKPGGNVQGRHSIIGQFANSIKPLLFLWPSEYDTAFTGCWPSTEEIRNPIAPTTWLGSARRHAVSLAAFVCPYRSEPGAKGIRCNAGSSHLST